MGLRKDYDDDSFSFTDIPMEEDAEELSHKKRVRKLLEQKLERKRLKEEFDELDGEFDWDDLEK
ncbi:hypothetical protein ACFORL_09835 [Legionella dresdenensis]|uniref:DUF3545 domain-containing protein n=1 Tax=Legionella dresdenensis TaxID=450200 RepID=A0ABV8CGB6_9GAMM